MVSYYVVVSSLQLSMYSWLALKLFLSSYICFGCQGRNMYHYSQLLQHLKYLCPSPQLMKVKTQSRVFKETNPETGSAAVSQFHYLSLYPFLPVTNPFADTHQSLKACIFSFHLKFYLKSRKMSYEIENSLKKKILQIYFKSSEFLLFCLLMLLNRNCGLAPRCLSAKLFGIRTKQGIKASLEAYILSDFLTQPCMLT